MFAYYVDESYDNVTFCVGGWLTHVDHWDKIERDWLQRIEYERRRSIKRDEGPISRFHAADCSNRRGDYKEWSIDRQKLFFKKLIGIICRHKPVGIAWTASFKDLLLCCPGYKQRVQQRVLYFLCMQKCLRDALDIMRDRYPREHVAVIHDHGFNGAAQSAFALTRQRFDPTGIISTVAPMDWKDSPALQTADLIAYEGMKVCFRHRNNNPEIRRSFRRILGADLGLSVGFLNKQMFELAKNRAIAQQNDKALVLES